MDPDVTAKIDKCKLLLQVYCFSVTSVGNSETMVGLGRLFAKASADTTHGHQSTKASGLEAISVGHTPWANLTPKFTSKIFSPCFSVRDGSFG